MYRNNDTTLDKTADDEPIFVLVGRDPTAARTIMHWIADNLTTAADEKLREAFEWALEMRRYPHQKPAGSDASSSEWHAWPAKAQTTNDQAPEYKIEGNDKPSVNLDALKLASQ